MNDVDAACAREAERRYGILTYDELLSVGLSRDGLQRRLRNGRLISLATGIYRWAGAVRSWHGDLRVACLCQGPHGVVSHRAAAALHGLEGFSRNIVEVSTPRRTRRGTAAPAFVHVVRNLASVDVVRVDGLLVTDVARTIVDLASVVRVERLEGALDDALRRGQVSVGSMLETLRRLGTRGRRGAGTLRELLHVRESGTRPTESPLERRVLALLRAAGLPEPVRQYVISNNEAFVARIDLAYPDLRLAVEVDGYRYHSSRSAWQADLARQNRLTALGWTILRFTTDDVRFRPRQLVARVRTARARLSVYPCATEAAAGGALRGGPDPAGLRTRPVYPCATEAAAPR